jgi:hypothetical protein
MKLVLFIVGFLFFFAARTYASPSPCEFFGECDSMLTVPVESSSEKPDWHSVVTKPPSYWYAFGENMLNIDRARDVLYIGMLTGGLIAVDQQLYDATQRVRNQSRFAAKIDRYAISIGDGRYQFAAAGGLTLYGWLGDNPRFLRTASQMAESVIAVGIMIQVLKRITGRESPASSTRNGGTWRFFPNLHQYAKDEPKYYSFPSGHISSTTAILTVINENFPEAASWLRPVSYGIIGIVGVGLVGQKMHWYSDLLPGIALGYSFGLIAAHAKTSGSSASPQVSLYPASNGEFNGLALAIRF